LDGTGVVKAGLGLEMHCQEREPANVIKLDWRQDFEKNIK
jgi:hypothetical protein